MSLSARYVPTIYANPDIIFTYIRLTWKGIRDAFTILSPSNARVGIMGPEIIASAVKGDP